MEQVERNIGKDRGGKGLREVRVGDPVGECDPWHLCRLDDGLPSLYMVSEPHLREAYPIMGALGTALVGFNILALVMTLIPFKRARAVGLVRAVDVAPAVALAVRLLAGSSYLMLALLTRSALSCPTEVLLRLRKSLRER